MSTQKQKNFNSAVALLVGTAVGAGIFGLPYAIQQAGFGIGIIELLVLGGILLLVNLAYGEIILRTPQKKQLIGYAELYLGKPGKYASLLALFLGIYGALIAYTIEVGTFLHALLAKNIGGTPMMYSLSFFTVMAIILFLGIKVVTGVEKIMVMLIFIVVAGILLLGIPHIDMSNFMGAHPEKAFIPFGVILFALAAGAAIPTMREVLDRDAKKLKKAIFVGSLIPFLLYLGFTVIVLGVTGPDTTESAVLGLGKYLGEYILFSGAIFGILAMTTSFVSLAFVLSDSYQRDLGLKKNTAKVFVLVLPLMMVLLKAFTFIQIIGIGGAILGGTEGIIVLMIHKRAKRLGKRQPEYSIQWPRLVSIGLVSIFILGIIYQIGAFTGLL
ncbi:MAG: hypothetical protein A3F54_01275 [Candidatus Kerfeldbacteria bacterium RIFCSPHIGHO2_12_FULL_48_17]|uniref:Amino acid transporter transmembrane domain-containing protein n=1 Tax=Candidatus Kerfeldbacteria bacterium RIFCSPHIGHO2_12_FULL_48_17 TaxID=1798542 RepID=A0A1G2AYT6_9BACT|nr:MAG: hypothetical protein A3F54_01275 [Candidatus Kerfeldbacteria bacterium RIFCSPHIGHO2_12_FULL_48_17]